MYRRPVLELHFDRRGMQGDDLTGHLTHFELIAYSQKIFGSIKSDATAH